jgi:hypothetical protein
MNGMFDEMGGTCSTQRFLYIHKFNITNFFIKNSRRYVCAFVVPSKCADVLRIANDKTRIFVQVKKNSPRRKC